MANLRVRGPYFDTNLASRVLSAGLKKSHDLATLADKYLKIKLDKQAQHSDFSETYPRLNWSTLPGMQPYFSHCAYHYWAISKEQACYQLPD
jgi:DNA polymerase I-like protein with 3'-5' exonuclease and polymerase domains